MTYLPPQAQLLIKNVQTANQAVLRGFATTEIDRQNTPHLPAEENVFCADPVEANINSEHASTLVQGALSEVDAEIFGDDELLSIISTQAMPRSTDKRTPEEVNTLKSALRLSLQFTEAPETSFSIQPRQCVHRRNFDECRTCSLQENHNKSAAELFFADLEWHSTWKQEQLL